MAYADTLCFVCVQLGVKKVRKPIGSHFCPEGKRDIWISLDENRDINRLLRAWINIYLAAFFPLLFYVRSVCTSVTSIAVLSNLNILVLSNVYSANVPFHAIFPGDWWRKAAFYLFSDEKSDETKQQLSYYGAAVWKHLSRRMIKGGQRKKSLFSQMIHSPFYLHFLINVNKAI